MPELDLRMYNIDVQAGDQYEPDSPEQWTIVCDERHEDARERIVLNLRNTMAGSGKSYDLAQVMEAVEGHWERFHADEKATRMVKRLNTRPYKARQALAEALVKSGMTPEVASRRLDDLEWARWNQIGRYLRDASREGFGNLTKMEREHLRFAATYLGIVSE